MVVYGDPLPVSEGLAASMAAFGERLTAFSLGAWQTARPMDRAARERVVATYAANPELTPPEYYARRNPWRERRRARALARSRRNSAGRRR